MYAAQYGIAEGVCVITRDEAFYFTDGRYIEAAQNNLEGFTALIVDREHPYTDRINEVIAKYTVKTLGFEEAELTYAEYQDVYKRQGCWYLTARSAICRRRF